LEREIAAVTVEMIRDAAKIESLEKELWEQRERAPPIMDGLKMEDTLVEMVVEECDKTGLSRESGLKILHTLMIEAMMQREPAARETTSPMASAAKAFELQGKGVKLIRLDIGEPDFHPPEAVVRATSDALAGFKTHYTMARGVPNLVSALQRYLERKSGFLADPNQLMVTSSGRFAVYASLATVVKEGESAIVPEPNWPAYKECLSYIGARPIVVRTELENHWAISASDVENAIQPNTKAIVLSYPGNPTGKIIDKSAFQEILGVANAHGLTVISDEIYNEYAYKPCPSILEGGAESFILTSSFSKTWAMTGFRIGYAVSSKDIIDKMLKIVSLVVTSVPEFIQYGAIAAFSSDTEVAENSKTMKERIELVADTLASYPELEFEKPDGAMYFFPRCARAGFNAAAFASRLLDEKAVSITPGMAFGNYPDFFRISLGQPAEVLKEGVNRIGDALVGPVRSFQQTLKP
jgi:aspartate aminotransferase